MPACAYPDRRRSGGGKGAGGIPALLPTARPVVEPEAGVTPHAVLCFAPAADVRGALKLFGAVPDLGALALGPPPGLECRTAEGLPLLALLWEEGRLDLANIQILEAN